VIVSGWAAITMMCVAAPDPAVISRARRIARLETIMSADSKTGTDPNPCPTDDEDPVDVPTTNGSGGNGPPPPPVED